MMRSQLNTYYNNLCKQMLGAQNRGEFCDLDIVCNGHTIPVHKVVICLQSPVIKAACTGSFAESCGRYEIKDCSYETVQGMVDYLYTGNYDTYTKESPKGQSEKPGEIVPGQRDVLCELVQHVKMFGLADKYLMDGLIELSRNKFKKTVRDERDTCAFSQFVAEVYDLQCESSKELRDIVVESVRERVAVTPLKPNVQEAVDGLIDEIPEFAGDLARSYLRRPILGHCTTCGTHKLVSISTLQCRCEECGKGGASPLGSWYEGKSY
ncbi:BTB/POZ protein [Trichoderma camerunense]